MASAAPVSKQIAEADVGTPKKNPPVDATAPKLNIKGFTCVSGGVAKQKKSAKSGGHNGYIAMGDAGLYFRVDGGDRGKLAYALVADLDLLQNDFGVNKVFIELSGLWGTFQVGNRKGPLRTMFEDGISVVGIGHGVDGGMWGLFSESAGSIGYSLVGDGKTCTRAIYYTPIVEGFQFAVAYTPNTSHSGDEKWNNNRIHKDGTFEKGFDSGIYPKFKERAQPYGVNNISALLKYKREFGNWMVGGAIGGLVEHSILINPYTNERVPVNNAKSYGMSLTAGYKKIVAGFGYGNNCKSRLPRNGALSFYSVPASGGGEPTQSLYLGDTHQGNSGSFTTLGLAYDPGKYKIAVGYASTKRKNTATTRVGDEAYVTYLAYRPIKGLEFFAEGTFVRSRTNSAAIAIQQAAYNTQGKGQKAVDNNAGYVVLVGTSVAF